MERHGAKPRRQGVPPSAHDPAPPRSAPRAAYECPAKCWDPATKKRFWGFATVIVDVSSIAERSISSSGNRCAALRARCAFRARVLCRLGVRAQPFASLASTPRAPRPSLPPPPTSARTCSETRLRRLAGLGYSYSLDAPLVNKTLQRIAVSPASPVDPIERTIELPTAPEFFWRLKLAPADGWVPAWRGPVLAVAIIVSFGIGALSAVIMLSRRRLVRLVSRLQVRCARRTGLQPRK